jgi:tetratricopeptide (TPR) repeat protein
MTDTFRDALSLYEERRWDEALAAFRALAEADPADARARGYLALTLLELHDEVDADRWAREAVETDPTEAAGWHALAGVALRSGHLRGAENAIRRALQIEPLSARYLGVAALVQQKRHRWTEALSMAEQGLRYDGADPLCVHVRARALIKMGRLDVGRAALRKAVDDGVDSPLVRADLGWTELDRGDREAAVDHFVTALSDEPDLEWAREGLGRSLRSPLPLYNWILGHFLRVQRYRDDRMFGVLGEMMISRLVESLARRWERLRGLAVLYGALRGLYTYLSWVARPMSNLLLLLHPIGRRALSSEQRAEGGLASIGVVCAALSVAGCFFLRLGPSLVGLVESLMMLTVLSATFDCHEGWPRRVMIGLLAALTGIGLFAFVRLAIWFPDWTGRDAFSLFMAGTVLADVVSMLLRRVQPTRPLKRRR